MSERKDSLLRRAKGLSKAFLVGTVGRDPYVNEKGTFASFNLCTSFARKNPLPGGGEEWEDVPTWWQVKILGENAVNRMIKQGIVKGDYVQVYLADIELEKYNDKDGYEAVRLTGRADSFQNLVYREDGETSAPRTQGEGTGRRRPAATQQSNNEPQGTDDDVPF